MRILVISDIHANYTAFDTILKHAEGEWDYVWCLGDVVGYGPDPNECVERLNELPHLCLAGNHDWAVLDRLDSNTFNTDARQAVQWTADRMTEANLEWLKKLPSTYIIGQYTLVHASPREPILEYIIEPVVAGLNWPHFATPICIVGHTHHPVIFEQMNEAGETRALKPEYDTMISLNESRKIVNPGSIGQPRDADPRAAYGILDFESGTFEHRRVEYDIAAVQSRMQDFDLPPRLIERLAHGR